MRKSTFAFQVLRIVEVCFLHFALCSLLCGKAAAQGVGINTTGNPANTKAILDIDDTNKGLLIPRLTTAQRDAIATPIPESLFIFNTTTKCFEAYVNGAWNTVSCPAACTPPTAPVSNAASGIGCTSFTANWTASAGATAYLLDVATDAGFTSFVAGYNNLNVGNVTSSPVSGLAAGTAYYYRVRATTACVSGNSGTQNPTTLAAPTTAPTAGAHTPSQTQIVWNWNAVAGATGYKWNTVNDYATATDNGASTTKTQTGLTCNTAYTLYAWAYNACGNYATPVTLTQTTSACCPCIVAGFPLRKPISITNTSGSNLTNYQVSITVTYDADMKSDFADLRFRDGSCTDLAYWVETYTASTSATVWIKVPSIPTSGTTIYMYYGNAGASSTSNGTNTFDFFDHLSLTKSGADAGLITLTSSTKTNMDHFQRPSVAWAYKQLPNYYGNFHINFEVYYSSLWSADHGTIGMADAGGTLYGATAIPNGLLATTSCNYASVCISKLTSGTQLNSSSAGLPTGSLYYATFSRLGNAVTYSVYSDAARTTHISGSPMTYTDPSVVNFNYLLIFSSGAFSSANDDSGYVQNAILRNYASPEPSPSVGAEESCN